MRNLRSSRPSRGVQNWERPLAKRSLQHEIYKYKTIINKTKLHGESCDEPVTPLYNLNHPLSLCQEAVKSVQQATTIHDSEVRRTGPKAQPIHIFLNCNIKGILSMFLYCIAFIMGIYSSNSQNTINTAADFRSFDS